MEMQCVQSVLGIILFLFYLLYFYFIFFLLLYFFKQIPGSQEVMPLWMITGI